MSFGATGVEVMPNIGIIGIATVSAQNFKNGTCGRDEKYSLGGTKSEKEEKRRKKEKKDGYLHSGHNIRTVGSYAGYSDGKKKGESCRTVWQ